MQQGRREIRGSGVVHGAATAYSPPRWLFWGDTIYDLDCAPGFNHAVTMVGTGEENGTPYWKVKNSFGRGWGDAGYFRIVRGKNVCGIEQVGFVPVARVEGAE